MAATYCPVKKKIDKNCVSGHNFKFRGQQCIHWRLQLELGSDLGQQNRALGPAPIVGMLPCALIASCHK